MHNILKNIPNERLISIDDYQFGARGGQTAPPIRAYGTVIESAFVHDYERAPTDSCPEHINENYDEKFNPEDDELVLQMEEITAVRNSTVKKLEDQNTQMIVLNGEFWKNIKSTISRLMMEKKILADMTNRVKKNVGKVVGASELERRIALLRAEEIELCHALAVREVEFMEGCALKAKAEIASTKLKDASLRVGKLLEELYRDRELLKRCQSGLMVADEILGLDTTSYPPLPPPPSQFSDPKFTATLSIDVSETQSSFVEHHLNILNNYGLSPPRVSNDDKRLSVRSFSQGTRFSRDMGNFVEENNFFVGLDRKHSLTAIGAAHSVVLAALPPNILATIDSEELSSEVFAMHLFEPVDTLKKSLDETLERLESSFSSKPPAIQQQRSRASNHSVVKDQVDEHNSLFNILDPPPSSASKHRHHQYILQMAEQVVKNSIQAGEDVNTAERAAIDAIQMFNDTNQATKTKKIEESSSAPKNGNKFPCPSWSSIECGVIARKSRQSVDGRFCVLTLYAHEEAKHKEFCQNCIVKDSSAGLPIPVEGILNPAFGKQLAAWSKLEKRRQTINVVKNMNEKRSPSVDNQNPKLFTNPCIGCAFNKVANESSMSSTTSESSSDSQTSSPSRHRENDDQPNMSQTLLNPSNIQNGHHHNIINEDESARMIPLASPLRKLSIMTGIEVPPVNADISVPGVISDILYSACLDGRIPPKCFPTLTAALDPYQLNLLNEYPLDNSGGESNVVGEKSNGISNTSEVGISMSVPLILVAYEVVSGSFAIANIIASPRDWNSLEEFAEEALSSVKLTVEQIPLSSDHDDNGSSRNNASDEFISPSGDPAGLWAQSTSLRKVSSGYDKKLELNSSLKVGSNRSAFSPARVTIDDTDRKANGLCKPEHMGTMIRVQIPPHLERKNRVWKTLFSGFHLFKQNDVDESTPFYVMIMDISTEMIIIRAFAPSKALRIYSIKVYKTFIHGFVVMEGGNNSLSFGPAHIETILNLLKIDKVAGALILDPSSTPSRSGMAKKSILEILAREGRDQMDEEDTIESSSTIDENDEKEEEDGTHELDDNNINQRVQQRHRRLSIGKSLVPAYLLNQSNSRVDELLKRAKAKSQQLQVEQELKAKSATEAALNVRAHLRLIMKANSSPSALTSFGLRTVELMKGIGIPWLMVRSALRRSYNVPIINDQFEEKSLFLLVVASAAPHDDKIQFEVYSPSHGTIFSLEHSLRKLIYILGDSERNSSHAASTSGFTARGSNDGDEGLIDGDVKNILDDDDKEIQKFHNNNTVLALRVPEKDMKDKVALPIDALHRPSVANQSLLTLTESVNIPSSTVSVDLDDISNALSASHSHRNSNNNNLGFSGGSTSPINTATPTKNPSFAGKIPINPIIIPEEENYSGSEEQQQITDSESNSSISTHSNPPDSTASHQNALHETSNLGNHNMQTAGRRSRDTVKDEGFPQETIRLTPPQTPSRSAPTSPGAFNNIVQIPQIHPNELTVDYIKRIDVDVDITLKILKEVTQYVRVIPKPSTNDSANQSDIKNIKEVRTHGNNPYDTFLKKTTTATDFDIELNLPPPRPLRMALAAGGRGGRLL